jgi:hypothetical protein
MKERQEERLSPLPKIGEGFGEWFEALLRMKEGWVVVTLARYLHNRGLDNKNKYHFDNKNINT